MPYKIFLLTNLILLVNSLLGMTNLKNNAVEILKNSVHCPYAKKSLLWKSNFEWNLSNNIETNILHFIEQDLIPFTKTKEPIFDVLALEVPGDVYNCGMDSFSDFFRQVMLIINKDSVGQLQNLKPDDSGYFWDDGWQMSFMQQRFFIITFAPFYPESNSRFNYGLKETIILFQTESSFKQHLAKSPERRENQKKWIRKIFDLQGQPYSNSKCIEPTPIKKTHEAPRYIKPLSLADNLIQWWIEKD
jgi:hypothetical protein